MNEEEEKLNSGVRPVFGLIAVIVSLAALTLAILAYGKLGENYPTLLTVSQICGAIAVLAACGSLFLEHRRRMALAAGGIAIVAFVWEYVLIAIAIGLVIVILVAVLDGL